MPTFTTLQLATSNRVLVTILQLFFTLLKSLFLGKLITMED